MVALDTNILVRFLTRDNEAEYRASEKLISVADVFIPDSVILETEWVLRYAYDLPAAEICHAFRKLFGLKNVRLSDDEKIARAIDWCEAGLDFADAFHLSHSLECDAFKTFDKGFIKKAKTLSSCRVEKP